MKWWTFCDYETKEKEIPIRDWYKAQDRRVQSEFDLTVRILTVTQDWLSGRQPFKLLEREHVGLGEIVFSVDVAGPRARKFTKRRFRPVGILRVVEHEFIFLVGCEKSDRNIYRPPNAFDTALRYKSELERGLGAVHDHDV